MENTLENKAKFFALYFGQEVRVWKELPENKCNVGYASLSTDAIRQSYLKLKDISSITDEDLKMITKIKDSKNLIGIIQKNKIDSTYFIQQQIDYLRSKGYAITYMTLSVEKQIEYGWIKIKNLNITQKKPKPFSN